uniref:Uncharacterized protein n=1 Tax=Nymphaea colorata TaxID=210225 RepID=A0A5K1FFB1_9MAGN|nr:unnamed protein product [Nymphaea colorata]
MGLASSLLRTRRSGGGSEEGDRVGVAAMIVGEAESAVFWEQREKDVEAERERSKITSPGFSFSAAGLSFPYHLGVTQIVLEKGYIRVMKRERVYRSVLLLSCATAIGLYL